jgi:hypothetical protein
LDGTCGVGDAISSSGGGRCVGMPATSGALSTSCFFSPTMGLVESMITSSVYPGGKEFGDVVKEETV